MDKLIQLFKYAEIYEVLMYSILAAGIIRFLIEIVIGSWDNIKSRKKTTKCNCCNEDKHGETSVMCCNECGKPTESFWITKD